MELFEIIKNASIDDMKVGAYVIAGFMSLQLLSSIGRYYFGMTLNPFDHIASFFAPKHCMECKNIPKNCSCFIHLKSYESMEENDD